MRGVERMRAVVLGRDGDDGAARRPRAATRATARSSIRVTAVGLCGSDVEKLADGTGMEGSVLGHELAGVVEAGALPAGTRVALAHRVPCGACAGLPRGPRDRAVPQYLASGLRPGGFAELLVAPASHVGRRRAARCPTTCPTSPGRSSSRSAASSAAPLGCPRGTGVVAGCGAVGRLFARVLAARGDTRARARRRSPRG